MSNFRVGQKVVCVNSKNTPGKSWYGDVPVVGQTYTIEDVFIGPITGTISLLLEEIKRSEWERESIGVDKLGYHAWRFRPVISQADDIALFHALCPGLPVVPPAVVPPRVPVTSHSD